MGYVLATVMGVITIVLVGTTVVINGAARLAGHRPTITPTPTAIYTPEASNGIR